MKGLKGVVLGAEAIVLLALGTANVVSGQLLGAAILIGIGLLAVACAWALRPPTVIDKVASHGSDRLDRGRRR